MKPLKVEFQAFGPYVGYESVDFSKLSDKGLFLICGKTGTGKTTILDAITFALFGKSSGSGRDSFESMRCTNADDNTDTFVRFEFENNGSYYLFERRLERKRKNFSKVYNAARRNEDGIYVPLFENAKDKNLNEKAEEIIGLEYDQFIQVIVLPQGKFEKLLISNSNDKEEILTSIFGEDRWQQISEYVFAEAMERINSLKLQRDKIEQSLSEENCDSLTELKVRIDDKKEELDKITYDFESSGYESDLKKQQDLLTVAGRFESLNQLQEKVADYESKKEQCEQWEKEYSEASKAEKVRPLIYELEKAEKRIDSRNYELELCKLSIADSQTKAKQSKQQYDEHIKNEAEIQNQNVLKIQYEEKKNSYAEIDKVKNEHDGKLKEIEKIRATVKEKRKAYEAYTPVIENLTSQWEKLNAELDDYLKHYIAGISGILAEQLSDNEPCPVCGSTTHPKKAIKTTDSVTEEELNQKKKQQDDKYSQLQDELSKQQKAKSEFESSREHAQSAENEEAAIRARYESMKDNLVQGIETYDELVENIDKLEKIISSYQKKKEQLEQEYKKATDAVTEAKAKIEPAEKELADAIQSRNDAAKMLYKSIIAEGFYVRDDEKTSEIVDVEENSNHENKAENKNGHCNDDHENRDDISNEDYKNKNDFDASKDADEEYEIIASDLNRSIDLARNLLMSETAREALKTQIDDFKAGYKQAQENVISLKNQLKGIEQPDINKCREIIDEINAKKTEYAEVTTALKLQIENLSAKYANLSSLGENIEERLKEAENDYAFAKSLRGDTGTGLQRYVLGIMFSSVVAAANKMLEMVHDGRYHLYRTDEKAQGSNKRGLELKVYDKYSEESEGRFVNTLSGGEKFLASLALSIGMSTVAQKSGIKIEALFIDEGFGSLDEDSIGDAMNILNSIQEANGLVGIISHVQLLQDRIPTKLRVVEAERGSHIVQTVG